MVRLVEVSFAAAPAGSWFGTGGPDKNNNLGALGLVTNAITLWNTTYINRAIDQLQATGATVDPGDIEHLSPLQHEQINLHGRYSFLLPDYLRTVQLRPLPSPETV